MNLIASLGSGASAGAGGAATTAATSAGAGGFLNGLVQSAGDLGKINSEGGGMGTASSAFAKMFGGEVSNQDVQSLNTFQVGGQMKRKQADPLDDTRQQFQDWLSLMNFTA